MSSSNASRRGVSTAGRAHQTSHRMVTCLVLPHTVPAPIKEDVAVARFDRKKLGALDWIGMSVGALILILIRWITLPSPTADQLAPFNLRPEEVDSAASIGLYLGLLAAVISIVGAVFRVLIAVRPVQTKVYTPPPAEPGS